MNGPKNEIVDCILCGEEVAKDDAKYDSGNVNESGVQKLGRGETIGVDELFEYDKGPYCSIDCLIEGDS